MNELALLAILAETLLVQRTLLHWFLVVFERTVGLVTETCVYALGYFVVYELVDKFAIIAFFTSVLEPEPANHFVSVASLWLFPSNSKIVAFHHFN